MEKTATPEMMEVRKSREEMMVAVMCTCKKAVKD